MSANNIWFALEKKGKWYGWDTTAEAVVSDKEVSKGVYERVLPFERAVVAKSIGELQDKLGDSMLGYAEYGLSIIKDNKVTFS